VNSCEIINIVASPYIVTILIGCILQKSTKPYGNPCGLDCYKSNFNCIKYGSDLELKR
jgi:hypothetical protein